MDFGFCELVGNYTLHQMHFFHLEEYSEPSSLAKNEQGAGTLISTSEREKEQSDPDELGSDSKKNKK